MGYQLYYFPTAGRGEQIRLLLLELDQPFEDIIVSKEEFGGLKQKGPGTLPYGALPVLRDGDFTLAQGPVIAAYLGRKHGLAPAGAEDCARAESVCLAAEDLRMKYFAVFGPDTEQRQAEFAENLWRGRWQPNLESLLELNGNTGYFVGDSLTYADIAMWDVVDAIQRYVAGARIEGHPKLQAFYDTIAARPRIKDYLATRSD